MADAISGIGSLPVVAPAKAPVVPGPAGGDRVAGSLGFGDTLARALTEVNDLQQNAAAAASSLARGEHANMADTVLAVEKANISLSFTVQIRNKLLEAYQELMRMQI